MAFDAGFLKCVMTEIDELKESRIEKIYQPSNDEIVIFLHSAAKKSKILINAGSNYPRIAITEATPIIIPSIVRRERIKFVLILKTAMRIFSLIFKVHTSIKVKIC